MTTTKKMPHSAATEVGRMNQNPERNQITMSSTIVGTHTVSVQCHDSACDKFGGAHVVPAGMEPAVHEIALEYVELGRSDGDGEWHAWLPHGDAEYDAEALAKLVREATRALAMMRDLNAGTASTH